MSLGNEHFTVGVAKLKADEMFVNL